jgi:acetyl esterase
MKIAHPAVLALFLSALPLSPLRAQTPPKPDPQMKAVLDQLAALGGKPIEKLSPQQARKQPTPADAVKALLQKQGKSADPEPVGSVQNTTVPGPAGPVPVRVYTPAGEGPFPVIVYIHGGGWVIATVDTYDSSPRAMVNLTNAVVVSVEYRKAPEHKFPAAHEDCYAVLQYVMKHAGGMKGDPKRVAVMGESAGGNMASAICMMARDRKGMMPRYEVLVYPVADTNVNTPSYKRNANAKPLNKPMMQWFFRNTVKSASDANNRYLAILKGNVRGLPPTTVITAEIDPLMSEGAAYASKLKQAGIPVQYRNYTGVTHEFFGMGAAVDKAKDAEQFAAEGLKAAFRK